jgi:thiamine pyrophosphokinase
MSSHHFVKEKQEPALYIHSEKFLNTELLGQLLEWCPFVIVDEHALYILNHEPIKIDLVIQQLLSDSEISEWTANQPNIKIIKLDETEDKLLSLLQYLEKENHFAISLLACSDEHFKIIQTNNFNLDIIQYTEQYKGFFIDRTFKKWKEKDSEFEINVEEIETKNLIRCNSIWKVIEDGLVEIQVKSKTYIKEFKLGN